MKITEIFHSIQGEGLLAGVPSTFIRTTGCNLRCTWCDTPESSWAPEGEEMGVTEIVARVATFPTKYVVVTGGEPMMARRIESLTFELRQRGFHVTIETAATLWKSGVVCDLASISPKLSNSTPVVRAAGDVARRHELARIRLDVIRRFMEVAPHQIKFVIEEPSELAEIETLLEEIVGVDRSRVLLMPQGITKEELDAKAGWVAELCKETGFRFCPRLHVMLYGNTRGT